MKSEIKNIKFGVYSSDEILDMSVCEITSIKKKGANSVYDPRMGVTDSSLICPTCDRKASTCTGHFGYIKLAEPIFHPLYIKHIINVLNCVCFKCFRCMVTRDQSLLHNVPRKCTHERFTRMIELCKKNNHCCNDLCLEERDFKLKFCTNDNVLYVMSPDNKTTQYQLSPSDVFLIFDNMTDEEVNHIGLNYDMCHPRNFIMFYFLVLPPIDRPFVKVNGCIWDDDITLQYCEIIKSNEQFKTLLCENDDSTMIAKKDKLMACIKFRIHTTFNNSQCKAKHTTNGRPVKGIKERLTGKEGQIRNNMMGKRCNFSARTVIGPDPTIKSHQIILPEEMTNVLTIPVRVNRYNIENLQGEINNGRINTLFKQDGKTCINIKRYRKGTMLYPGDSIVRNGNKIDIKDTNNVIILKDDKIVRNGTELEFVRPTNKKYLLEVGMIVNRKLKDGDWVLLNRQPTLHKGSMLAVQILVKKYRTIRMNLSICKTFNADFDGDEMNIHVPQGIEAQTELEMLSCVEANIISPQSGKPNMAIVQDSLLGAYTMSKGFEMITKADFYNIALAIGLDIDFNVRVSEINQIYQEQFGSDLCFSGRGIISLFLPIDLNYEHTNNADVNEPIFKIKRGVICEGAIDKSIIGSSHVSLIHIINKEYGPSQAMFFIDCIQFCTAKWLLLKGFTVGFGDCLFTNDQQETNIKEVIRKCIIEAEVFKNTSSHNAIKEIRIKSALNKAKDVGLKIAKDSLLPTNNFLTTVISGSKGDFFNISQITGLLGQQDLRGQRVPYGLNNGTRSLPHYPLPDDMTPELGYESKGFISSSFIKGLNPREFFFHAMSGREGITDTAMGTATSGYIQRRIVKLTEDIIIQYDGTVRDNTGRIYQFAYGDNNLDPTQTTKVNGRQQSCNIKRLSEQLNTQYELECSA